MAVSSVGCMNSISIHSLTRRLTRYDLLHRRNGLYFNSQPHKEADPHLEMYRLRQNNFNSQPHKEADHQHCTLYHIHLKFQFTASQGG